METVLVLDSGTTNTKAFLYGRAAAPSAVGSVPTPISFPGPDRVEQNAADWFSCAVRAVRGLPDRRRVGAVSGSYQGGTFVLLDRDGGPLLPAVTWLDNRAHAIAAAIEADLGPETVYRTTGHRLGGWAPPAAIRWVRERDPSLWRRARRVSFVADYVNARLTGRHFLDPSSAAMTCLYDVTAGRWDPALCAAAGVAAEMLPEVVPSASSGGGVSREAARAMGLVPGVPVAAGGHDQYCASLGAGAAEPGRVLVSCGTAWAVLARTGGPVFAPDRTLSPGPHVVPGGWGLMGAVGNGGVLHDWARRLCAGGPGRPARDRVVAPVVLPVFSEGRGAVVGLDLAAGPADILSAVGDTLCFQAREMLEAMAAAAGDRPRELVMIGGGARDVGLRMRLADATGLPVVVPRVREAAGRGAGLLARPGAGRRPGGGTVAPDPRVRGLCDEKYRRYRELRALLGA